MIIDVGCKRHAFIVAGAYMVAHFSGFFALKE
jgi:hypothetical protein